MSIDEREPFFGDLACNKLYEFKKETVHRISKQTATTSFQNARASYHNNQTSVQIGARLFVRNGVQFENWVYYKLLLEKGKIRVKFHAQV